MRHFGIQSVPGYDKLRHYFYDHKIIVVSKDPLNDIINNNDAT
jgi:hypothetical protein